MSNHSNLCIWVRILVNSTNSSGTEIPDIGAFRDSPDSFLVLQVEPLNSSILAVSSLKETSSGVLSGNYLTSTALVP